MKKICLVLGTRPEIIKCAILANKLKQELGDNFQLYDTGQHYDYNMDKIFYDQMGIIPPDVNLDVRSGTTAEQMSILMSKVENELKRFNPQLVIVVGDTNSTFGTTYIAKRLGIKVAHIEAGPREYFINYIEGHPYFHKNVAMLNMPENLNRILIDNASDYLFAPTKMSYDNLIRENVLGKKMFSGDIQVDVLNKYLPQIQETLGAHGIENEYNLLTLHRAENTDNIINLKSIIDAFIESKRFTIFPIHPRTENKLKEINKYWEIKNNPNFFICPPLGFFEFSKLLMDCKKVFTDSGGVQKEAYLLKKPCVVLRHSTGWIDLVLAGACKVVGSSKQMIKEELDSTTSFKCTKLHIYGSNATNNIINKLLSE